MKTINTKTAQEQLKNGDDIQFIDVRETDEVKAGKIPGAIHMPLGLIEFREHELNKNEAYIMVCQSGGRSGRATKYLDSKGYDVTNMSGGMLAWKGSIE